MKDRKNKIFLLGLLIVLIVLVIVLSYAIFSYAGLGKKDNIVTLGTLKLTLTEGEMINLSDTYPLTDRQGLELDGYSFTLENTGTADAEYTIYLDNVAIASPDVKLDDKYLKYSFNKNDVTGSPYYLTSLGTDGSRVLDSGTLNSGESNNYVLKVWPTTEIDGDFGGQVWKGKIRIIGEQVR